MHVLIIANHTSTDLAPIVQDSCICLLPIAGKPLIQHTLEAVARLNPDSTTIIASRGLEKLREFIGSGERWGLLIDVASSRPNESIAKLRKNNEKLFVDNLLIIECNRIRAFAFTDFLSLVQDTQTEKTAYSAHTDNEHAGLHYLEKGIVGSNVDLRSIEVEKIEIDDASSFPITTPAELHKVNMMVAANQVPSITTRGRERALGLTTGFMTQIHPRTLKSGRVYAGNHCRVDPSCSFNGNVVLNHGVVIDRHTQVENSLIMDHTYIGENLEIKNAILSGELLIRIDTGAIIEVTDRFLTARLGESLYKTHFANVTNQLMGIALFLLSLPLWPLALVMALINQPNAPIRSVAYIGNKIGKTKNGKKSFQTFQFSTKIRLLKNLPLVAAIANGDIRLVGVSLCTPGELSDRTDSWQTVRDNAPSGAIGPSQLHLPADVSLEEKMLTDAIFAQQANAKASLQIVWQACKSLLGIKGEIDFEMVGKSG